MAKRVADISLEREDQHLIVAYLIRRATKRLLPSCFHGQAVVQQQENFLAGQTSQSPKNIDGHSAAFKSALNSGVDEIVMSKTNMAA